MNLNRLSSSSTLSGNRANPIKNSAGKDDKNHTVVYRLKDISARSDVGLTRGGFILIGLLSGGDYHQAGLPKCGVKTAHALARCGFGDSLYQAALTHPRSELQVFLREWREGLRRELRTNSQGHLGRKNLALAKCVPDDFPDVEILLSYTNPVISETQGRTKDQLPITWDKDPDLGKLANICELYFEWGVKPIIMKRFRTIIWPSAVLRILRRAVLTADQVFENTPSSTPEKPRDGKEIETPSKSVTANLPSMRLNSPSRGEFDGDDDNREASLIVKIHSSRTHTSTDGIVEYRLEIAPASLVRLCEAGITGIRPPIADDEWADDGEVDQDEDRRGDKMPDPLSPIRVWMPACMVRIVEPQLVDQFECTQEQRQKKKARQVVSKAKLKTATCSTKAKPPTPGCENSSKARAKEPKVVIKKSTPVTKPITVAEDLTFSDNEWPQPKPATINKDIKSFFPVGKADKTTAKPKVASYRQASGKSTPLHSTIIELSDTEELSSQTHLHVTSAAASSRITFVSSLNSEGEDILLPVSKSTQSTKPPKKDSLNHFVKPMLQARPSILTTKDSRRKSQSTSESDSYQNDPNNSPRKSRNHLSLPCKERIRVDAESDRDGGANPRARPVTLSPLRERTKPTIHTVVEVSSDSDSPFTKLDTRPLLVARAKKANSETASSSRNDLSGLTKKVGMHISPADVLDLTD